MHGTDFASVNIEIEILNSAHAYIAMQEVSQLQGKQQMSSVYLEVKVTPVQPCGLGCVSRFNLHGNRLALLGCVDRLVVQLHTGNAPYVNATL